MGLSYVLTSLPKLLVDDGLVPTVAYLLLIARDAGITINEVAPLDDSIESVFAYLTERR